MSRILLLFLLGLMGFSGISQSLNLDSVSRFIYPSNVKLNDIWGYVDTLGNEYALVGKRNGLSVVSLADTNNLVEIFSEQAVFSIWRDLKTWGHYAYVTNESAGGLAIYDLSTLPDSVKSVSYFTGVNYAVNSAHNIYIDENGVAYLFGSNHSNGSFGTIMLDVATSPGQPVELGYFDSLYLHDGYARGDTLYGSAVYAGELLVIDVSNKLNPRVIGSASTPGTFTHNSWPSDNGDIIFTTDEVVDGYVAAYDVSNPSNIFQTDRIKTRNTTGIIPHNAHVLNDFVITSYYTYGVSIVDGNKPDNLIEIGYYDTSPLYNGGTFNGNWGAYPYLPSGLLLLSDTEEGLYVLRPNYKRASYLEGMVTSCSGSAISQAKIQIIGEAGSELTNLNGLYKTGSPQDGYRTVEVSAPAYYKQVFDSVLFVSGQVTAFNPQLIPNGDGLRLNVLDFTGNAINAAVLSFVNSDTSLNFSVDVNGVGLVPNIQFGAYMVSGGKWGFEPVCNQTFNFDCGTQFMDTLRLVQNYADNFNQDFNWLISGNESSGQWERAEPVGTVHNSSVANPGADENSDCGTFAFVTGNVSGSPIANDVDSTAILSSPDMDLTSYLNPYINFYSWFYNEGLIGNDALIVSFIDSANQAVVVDTINAANQSTSWDLRGYRVSDFISLTTFKSVRFTVQDNSPDHVVEAGIDNFFISEGLFVGIGENALAEKNMSVYPSPFNNDFIVELTSSKDFGELTIFDIHGRLIHAEQLSENQTRINASEFPVGIYIVMVQNEQGLVHSQKIVKN